MTSTWLTVSMATSRYLGICHPLRARELVGMTFARISVVFVFMFSILFNIPRFFKKTIDTMECQEGHVVYFGGKGFMEKHEKLDLIYNIVYFAICIAIPLVTLTFCNVHLIKALRRSAGLQQVHQRSQASIDGTHRFTFTLVVIVLMYIILVTPAEIFNFHREMVKQDSSRTDAHNLGAAISNTLQVYVFHGRVAKDRVISPRPYFVILCVVNVWTYQGFMFLSCRFVKGDQTFQLLVLYNVLPINRHTRNVTIKCHSKSMGDNRDLQEYCIRKFLHFL